MNSLPLSFNIPSSYSAATAALLPLWFTETAENVSLTMDLWSSRAKHGYLGVTVTWITPNFEIKDVMLENKYVPSPHTSETIANELHECIKSWNLEDRVTSITSDNSRNMVATFPFLNQKNGCKDI